MPSVLDLTALRHVQVNRDETVIGMSGSQTITFWIGTSAGGNFIVKFKDPPEVVLPDAGNGIYYDIATQLGLYDPIPQKIGRLNLGPAINWT